MFIGWGDIGDLSLFSSKREIKDAMRVTYDENNSFKNAGHAAWQFVNELKIGDIIFAKRGNNQIIGRGVVESDYKFDSSLEYDFFNYRKVSWTDIGEWDIKSQLAQKTLTDITAYTEDVNEINSLFDDIDQEDDEENQITFPTYTKNEFLNEVFINQSE
ncbi:hypothetical protein [uncultured Anaerococcus sp.]|uniref:hypothetical protein n=1 Tax=uncultured Anaerococcus sp. TaxID=293428 RepID=UPI002607A038|nr:hypothetical protein [uncultured Anaerococcus sp.]